MIVISIFKNRHMTRTALPTTYIRITIKWEKMLILTAQFFDFFACFLREEFFVIKFRRTNFSNEEMKPLMSTLYYVNHYDEMKLQVVTTFWQFNRSTLWKMTKFGNGKNGKNFRVTSFSDCIFIIVLVKISKFSWKME